MEGVRRSQKWDLGAVLYLKEDGVDAPLVGIRLGRYQGLPSSGYRIDLEGADLPLRAGEEKGQLAAAMPSGKLRFPPSRILLGYSSALLK